MPDCAFDIVLAACEIMGWDGAVVRVVSAGAGVEVEGARGAAAVAVGMAGAETGGVDNEVNAGVVVVGGTDRASWGGAGAGAVGGIGGWGVDAAVDEVAAVVSDGVATGGGGTAAGDGGAGRTEGD